MRPLEFEPGCDADLTRTVLHGLRLKGFVDTATVTDFIAHRADTAHRADRALRPNLDEIEFTLDRLSSDGLVKRSTGQNVRWSLTPRGRSAHERLLAAELQASGRRPTIERAYQDFLSLNPQLLDVCTRWQVRDIEASLVNDHSDPAYDAAVVQALLKLDAEAQPLLVRLAAALPRFRWYGPALAAAVDQVKAGNTEWFARPLIASYHTIWFELHEDLLATLGLERTVEAPISSAPASPSVSR